MRILERVSQREENKNAERLSELPARCTQLQHLETHWILFYILPRHATVDAKVDGVGQEDAGVDEHRDCVCDVVVDKVEAHAGIKSL